MTDKSSKRKNKDLRHSAYRRARSNIRSVIKPFWDRPLFDTGRAQVTFAGGDLDRAHTTDEFPAADLFRLVNHHCPPVNHHCPPGGDDRATEGRLQGMHRALTEIGRALYGPEYMPNNTEPIARQVARLADSLGQPDEQPALQAVLNAIGATWPEEWRGVPVTVDRVVAAIRSYYTEQTQGQAIREARAAERANILGMLGININPTAAPGTQGAVRQIRNWAAGRVLQQLHDELFRDSRRSEIPVPVTVPAADPAGYAGWLRDHLAQDAQQRRENLVFELGASSEQAAEITDDEELRAFLVADRQDTVVSTAHRIIRQSLGHEAARPVLKADTTANTPDAVISAAVEAVTAALQDRTPAPPAVLRYAELRHRYSAEHDGDFRDTALALLLAPGDRLMRPIGSTDGSPIFTLLEPRELWRLGPDRLADWTGPRMRIEAAALLMCAVDHGNEETTDA